MAGVWGVGFNHCGQIGPDFIAAEDAYMPNKHVCSMETDESGSAATCKLWKPNTCWRLQQVYIPAFVLCTRIRQHKSVFNMLKYIVLLMNRIAAIFLSMCSHCAHTFQVPMNTEDTEEWEVREVCAGGDFTVVHGR